MGSNLGSTSSLSSILDNLFELPENQIPHLCNEDNCKTYPQDIAMGISEIMHTKCLRNAGHKVSTSSMSSIITVFNI